MAKKIQVTIPQYANQNETDDWFDYNDEDDKKSAFHKKNGLIKKEMKRLVSILFYKKSEPLVLKENISMQNATSMIRMEGSMTSINTMLINDMQFAASKDDDSMSTLRSKYDDAPSASSADCLSTFEEWNVTRKPTYQISDDLSHKFTCYICTFDVSSRFTSKGKLSGCDHEFCYRCIWTWKNKPILDKKAFHCPLCRKTGFPMDELRMVKATQIPKCIHLSHDVVILDSDDDDIAEDYWNCKICKTSYEKLDRKDHDVRATGTTECCHEEVACFVCLKREIEKNGICPFCKKICDMPKVEFLEHHPSIIFQRDKDYVEWYQTHDTHCMYFREWMRLRRVSPRMTTNATTQLQMQATSNEINNEQHNQDVSRNNGTENLPDFSSSDEDDDPTDNYTGSDVE